MLLKLSILAAASLAAFALSGCVVAPPPPGAAYVAPPGVVYVAPTYTSPGPGWAWQYNAHFGWGWHHPRYGWHRGWR